MKLGRTDDGEELEVGPERAGGGWVAPPNQPCERAARWS